MLGINIIPNRHKSIPKKNMVIFGNCHFQEIQRNIIQYNEIRKNYLPYYICINGYVGNSLGPKTSNEGKKNFTQDHIELFKKADIFIYQNIESDRGFLNNKEVLKLVPSNCIKIKIPHYRTSIYHYSWYKNPYFDEMKKQINLEKTQINKIVKIKKYIKNINETTQDIKLFDEFIEKEVDDFKNVNNSSDINMYDFFISNWKNKKLFMGRGYPSSYFIFILTKKILEKINIFENLQFETMINNRTSYPRYFGLNTDFPIFKFWYDYNNFTFDKQYYWELKIPMFDYEFYYLQINIINKFGKEEAFSGVVFIRDKFKALEEVKKLRNIINNT